MFAKSSILSPINTSLVPRNGWEVTIEGAGPTIRSDNFSDFIRQVRVRLESNGMDIHGWREETIDLMCHQRPDIPCEDRESKTREVTGADLRRFVRTIYEAWKDGAQPVSVEEQDRRAAICFSCPNRGHVACFGGCGALAEALSEMVVAGKGNRHPELHRTACLSCGCETSSLILYPMEVLMKVDAKVDFLAMPYSPQCWKRPENHPNIPPNPELSSPQPDPVA